MCVKFVEKNVYHRALKRHETFNSSSILKKVATSKTAEKLKKTVSPTLQISQFEKIVKELPSYFMDIYLFLKT